MPDRLIDLSSDTATKPSREMRAFMADAEVGDEQRREDPTVNLLQEMVAELFGKEEALFLPSGTMCNAIAIKVHTRMGDEMILHRDAHPYTSEGGGPAALAGISCRLLDGPRGMYTAEQVVDAISPENPHSARSRLVSIENTTNAGTGKVWPLEAIHAIAAVAHERGLKTHMDGARLMNAVVASGIPAKDFVAEMDTAWVDLSKGLGCPVGGVLAGTHEDMALARRYKHLYGGAMRQAGIIAAAGVYALRHNVERMAEDHANAKLLAQGLAEIPGIQIKVDDIETNIVHFDVSETGRTGAEVNEAITSRGARMGGGSGPRMRAVTHLDVSRADIERTVEIMRDAVMNA
ncbi:MAG TPA: GntG family PLP-dependent aldolase [Thermomicrobiales bacterium]|nr:GntG family PLP-dependent aldolase [Thermomicrobiales bacterium]